ncbi:hypothetical protein EGR_04600 [Echinococcus granulosus]|uniref:Uncharacterized protein n=1 Tax=Echinococcus granulosus TaxID=6210 RepID=W6UHP6_ECHGR|nr:hypothetical protein EGR_04600 [Echinococcus granulosus]EUB60581.1 hypothetical protein EGR_04600 [Echinococcus granulosus]
MACLHREGVKLKSSHDMSGLGVIIFKDTDEFDLSGKCNALILLADVIENHEIVADNAPSMIFECILPQLSVGNQTLQGSAAYCLGVLLRHMDCLDYVSVSYCCDILLDFLCDPHDDVTISENAFGKLIEFKLQCLECIRLVLKFPESLNCIITNPKFPIVLRLFLSSHKSSLRCAALSFLVMLLSDEQNENITLYLHEVGILEFVYDCLSSELDIAKNALTLLKFVASSTCLMSKNAISYEKILGAKVDKKDEPVYRKTSMAVLERIFRMYTGSVDLFCSLSTIENFFVLIYTELNDLDSSFNETSRSKQLFRPFPLQLFTDCVIAYGDRLNQSMCQLKSVMGNIPDIAPFSGVNLNETQRKIENDVSKSLTIAISVQIHLGKAPAEILQGMLVLTRRVLKKGFPHSEMIECGATCWSKATSYSHALIDTNIRTVFKITIPLIIDTMLRAKNSANLLGKQDHVSIGDETISALLDPFDSKTFLLNLAQLTAYVIATGCLSFSDDALEIADHSFYPECERFWGLVLGGISRVPGGSVETVALLLDHLCCQTIEDSESDAGKVLPAAVIVATSLVHCTEFSIAECKSLEIQERITNLLSGLYKCILRAVSCLLIETLLYRISVMQTSLLLGIQGFSELLLLGEPAWTALAQKITYHCHSHEQLASLDLIWRLPVNYEFLSLIWSVWFPLLHDLGQQNVVRRLSETFENGYKSIKRSRAALDEGAASEGSEELSHSIGTERLALFVAEQLLTLPTKLEVPASTLFFQSDAFRVNFLRMLTLVVRLDNLFLNRTCLNRFVEIVFTAHCILVVSLLTDSRCEASGNLLHLLKILNTCLLMADEIALSQVTPHIVERVSAIKASWMYAQRSIVKTSSCLLLEEVCVLGTLLMFGEGPSGLYMNITPFRTKDKEEVYCPIFTIPDVLLRAIRGETPAMVSHRACCSAALLLLHAPRGLQMGPWPSHEESPNCSFYLQLLTALYSNLMDATLKPFRIIISSLFGRTLNQGSEEMIHANAPKEGPLFGDSVWNSIIIENFQLEEFDDESLPCSPFLLAFLAELLGNTFGLVVTGVDEKLLQEIVVFYAQQPVSPVPPGSPYAYLQRVMDNASCFVLTTAIQKSFVNVMAISMKDV